MTEHPDSDAQRDTRPGPRSAPRLRPRLTELVQVRFPADVIDEVRRRALADDRSVSAWMRRAVQHELDQSA